MDRWTDPALVENSIYQFDRIEQSVHDLWERYHEVSKSVDSLQAKLANFKDRAALLKAVRSTLGERFFEASREESSERTTTRDHFDCRCGIINKEDERRLERIVFRISRGLIFTRFT